MYCPSICAPVMWLIPASSVALTSSPRAVQPDGCAYSRVSAPPRPRAHCTPPSAPPPKPHASRPDKRVVDALLAEAHAHSVLDREVIEVEHIVGCTPHFFRAARSPVRRAGCRRSGRRHRANGSSPSPAVGHRPSFGAANGSSSSAVTSSATCGASGAGARGSTSPP